MASPCARCWDKGQDCSQCEYNSENWGKTPTAYTIIETLVPLVEKLAMCYEDLTGDTILEDDAAYIEHAKEYLRRNKEG